MAVCSAGRKPFDWTGWPASQTPVRQKGASPLCCVGIWTSGPQWISAFTYAGSNGTGDWRLGKLQVATRYNYPVLGTTTFTAPVVETYTYGGKQGRASKRDTVVTVSGGSPESFTQSWTWNDLGDPASVTYPQCTHAACTAATNRTVSPAYTNGWLTAVPGYTGAITYHPNGRFLSVDPQHRYPPSRLPQRWNRNCTNHPHIGRICFLDPTRTH